jgi:transcriptional regulator with XRE-family HTH domain
MAKIHYFGSFYYSSAPMNIHIHNIHQQIGKNVKKYRQIKGFTQLELAFAMGYESVSIVSMSETYNRGKHFNIEHLVKISHILEVDICKLLEKI